MQSNLARRAPKQRPEIPLSIYLQTKLDNPSREVRGYAITRGICQLVGLDHCKIPDGLLDQRLIEVIAANESRPDVSTVCDSTILKQAALGLGDRISESRFVAERIAVWKRKDFAQYERFLRAVLLGEQRRIGPSVTIGRRKTGTFPPVDPGLPYMVGILTEELAELRLIFGKLQTVTRNAASDPELAEQFATAASSGRSPHIADKVDKWTAFFLSNKARRNALRGLVENNLKRAPRRIVIAYVAHYWGLKPSSLRQLLKGR